MNRLLFYLLLVLGVTFSCEQVNSVGQVEKMTPQELAKLMMADPDVVEVFSLQREIANQRSLAILDKVILPDGPGTIVLSTSTSTAEIANYLLDHNFLERSANELGNLYAKRNKILPAVQTRYKPYRDMFTDDELVELGQLLPDVRAKVSSSAALEKVERQNGKQ